VGPPRSPLPMLLIAALGVVIAATVIGLIVLWPTGEARTVGERSVRARTESARVTGLAEIPCRVGQRTCTRVTVELLEGQDEGRRVSFTTGEAGAAVELDIGDRVRVYKNQLPPEAVIGGAQVDPYSFSDFERGRPLVLLAVVFALLVIAGGRLRGARALVGLVVSLVIVLVFIVPSIVEGNSAVEVALIGSLAIMLTTISLAHGLGAKTLAASLGTASSLFLTAALASVFTELAHLTGASSEEAIFVRATSGAEISLHGLLLAGMVIGALGVLDDVTVTQASTVMAVKHANPSFGFRSLLQSGLSVGRDHVAATVNTLVLAYVGASLPVLLIFSIGGTPFVDAVNLEAVAEQIVAMLVGSIGLIAAVPVTTALAAALATQISRERLIREQHLGHEH
jgi:uncharacterized membrane protein